MFVVGGRRTVVHAQQSSLNRVPINAGDVFSRRLTIKLLTALRQQLHAALGKGIATLHATDSLPCSWLWDSPG